MYFLLLSLIFAPGLAAKTPQGQDLQERVREIVDRHFLELPDDRRKIYTEKIVQACRNASSPKQLEETLAELPEAASYHASVVQHYKNRLRGFEPPPDVLVKGYDIQIDQLVATVDRAVRVEFSEQTRQTIAQQIETIIDAEKSVLKEKLLGDVGAHYVERELADMRKDWLDSLKSPLNANMDAPLPPQELASVLSEARDKAKSFAPIVLTREDLLSSKRMLDLGVLGLVTEVKKVTYRASEYSAKRAFDQTLAKRADEWKSGVAVLEKNYSQAKAKEQAEAMKLSRTPSAASPSYPPRIQGSQEVRMIFAFIFLSCLQEATADETFKRIEQAVDNAPSLKIDFSYLSVSIKDGIEDLRTKASGTVLLKKENKVNAVIPLPGDAPPAILVSDGQQLSCYWKGNHRTLTTSGARNWLSIAFARAGAYRGASCYALIMIKSPKEVPAVTSELPVSEVTYGNNEKDGKSLTYLVALGATGNVVKTQLWYDPKTNLPIKRVIWLKNPEHRITETYSEVSPTADIPEEMFKLTPENTKPR